LLGGIDSSARADHGAVLGDDADADGQAVTAGEVGVVTGAAGRIEAARQGLGEEQELAELDQGIAVGRGLGQASRCGRIAGQGHHLRHVLDVGVEGGGCGARIVIIAAVTAITAIAFTTAAARYRNRQQQQQGRTKPPDRRGKSKNPLVIAATVIGAFHALISSFYLRLGRIKRTVYLTYLRERAISIKPCNAGKSALAPGTGRRVPITG
jgi:hypothetical protein